MAHILISSSSSQPNAQDSFWDNGAQTILTVLIGTLLSKEGRESVTLLNLLNLLQKFGPD